MVPGRFAGQGMHWSWPVVFAKVSLGHGSHADLPTCDVKLPISQSMHGRTGKAAIHRQRILRPGKTSALSVQRWRNRLLPGSTP
eukprot:2049343-Rhodomonas_salina.3